MLCFDGGLFACFKEAPRKMSALAGEMVLANVSTANTNRLARCVPHEERRGGLPELEIVEREPVGVLDVIFG